MWSSDQRLLLAVCAAMLVLIVTVSVLAPQSEENDPRPTSSNPGPQGAKAAYLLFQQMGRHTVRWDQNAAALSTLDTGRTTLLLAEPVFAATDQKEIAAQLQQFLERGGRILATGPSGAELLPGGATRAPGAFQAGLCTTTPEGPGPLAAAGPVGLIDQGGWASDAAQFRVGQRCGGDSVVVEYPVPHPGAPDSGASAGERPEGHAVWWSSATPLTNAGLKQDANLRLLLASVGPGRDVVFDEALHREAPGLWDAAQGLPLRWLSAQAAVLFVLLVLSFGRRRGPIRAPVALPRSSPLEFAASMGDLYEKAEASSAAIDAARRRLLAVLTLELGPAQLWAADTSSEGAVPGATAAGLAPQSAIAELVRERVGGDWSRLQDHLRAASQVGSPIGNQDTRTEIAPRSALALVQALDQDAQTVQSAFASALRPVGEGEQSKPTDETVNRAGEGA